MKIINVDETSFTEVGSPSPDSTLRATNDLPFPLLKPKKPSKPIDYVVWTLDQALEMARYLQPLVKKYNYHIALGGGVLNKGLSFKDLDLYFMSLDNGKKNDTKGLVTFLISKLSTPVSLMNPKYGEDEDSLPYIYKAKFHPKLAHGTGYLSVSRIDVFILGSLGEEKDLWDLEPYEEELVLLEGDRIIHSKKNSKNK